MTTDASAPTVVLVHGAFHDAACFDRLVTAIEARGLQCVAPDRPGHGASTQPRGDLLGDAAAVAKVLDGIPGEKILVGHSYGGAVISQAAAGRSDVGHLVYIAALVLDAGESAQAQNGAPPYEATDLVAALGADERTGDLVVEPVAGRAVFYHDVDDAEADRLTARLQPQGPATLSQHATAGAWREIPSTYIACRQDRAVKLKLQRFFASRNTKSVELDTGHFPFLSQPDVVAEVIAEV